MVNAAHPSAGQRLLPSEAPPPAAALVPGASAICSSNAVKRDVWCVSRRVAAPPALQTAEAAAPAAAVVGTSTGSTSSGGSTVSSTGSDGKRKCTAPGAEAAPTLVQVQISTASTNSSTSSRKSKGSTSTTSSTTSSSTSTRWLPQHHHERVLCSSGAALIVHCTRQVRWTSIQHGCKSNAAPSAATNQMVAPTSALESTSRLKIGGGRLPAIYFVPVSYSLSGVLMKPPPTPSCSQAAAPTHLSPCNSHSIYGYQRIPCCHRVRLDVDFSVRAISACKFLSCRVLVWHPSRPYFPTCVFTQYNRDMRYYCTTLLPPSSCMYALHYRNRKTPRYCDIRHAISLSAPTGRYPSLTCVAGFQSADIRVICGTWYVPFNHCKRG